MNRTILIIGILTLLSGCSAHAPTMQEVKSYCRSFSTESSCDMQGNLCEQYSEVLLKPYSSAAECRKGCESVQMQSASQMGLQNCLPIFDAVGGKCNEYCNGNYE
ncbi:hypothetical protein SAMN05660337_1606 [Maridesulfovibrio ferrireducens]|uniref:Type IV secretion system putative lipoprotein virB7 n=1 Tax=Maridesulfovibrio ferrireducens TaxID=246191 RepID=A0A1G9FM99_9BACT|nr:lipoprotein [Maridesulfovibrio ferrireducens]SDK89303.1 hypothetical protein SAMN05660337_1606 [Maridesulfovibrio ferrireducens]